MTYYDAKDVYIVQGTKYELVEYNRTQTSWPKDAVSFWYHGVQIDLGINWAASDLSSVDVVQTNEELCLFIENNPKVLWTELTTEQQTTLLDCCQLIKEWKECPTLPAVVAWYLTQYANYDQQQDYYREVTNCPGGLDDHWTRTHFIINDGPVRINEKKTQADASLIFTACNRIRAYGAEQ